MQSIKHGWVAGTAAAVNIQLGYIPDLVIIYNGTDGDVINIGNPRQKVIAYTSESTEIKAGMEMVGATSGAKALVLQVIRDTGTVAAGDAAGWLIIDAETETGTFTAEEGYYTGSAGLADLTIAASAVMGVDVDTEVAADLGITAYLGTEAANSMGFTIAAAISEDAKLLSYVAYRNN